MCVDAETGALLWGIDLVEDYGAEIPPWYTAQCPLIDGGVAVLAPAGTSLLIGIRCDTGSVVWETPNPGAWTMSHSSVMPMTLDGKKMYVYAADGGVAGVSAEEEDRGRLLWSSSLWEPEVVAPSPVALEDGKIFLTAGYGAGSTMIEVRRDGDSYSVRELYAYAPGEGLSCEQQTPVYFRGFLYGIAPKDGGSFRNQFLCADPDSGAVRWSSGKTERFGLGPFLVVDEMFLILSDDGTLSLVDVSADSFSLLARRKVLEGRDAWAPMAMAGGKLLLRDSRQLVCLDVSR
jgi:outer membrane protein assembly factor BamB